MSRTDNKKEKYLKHHLRHSIYSRILAMMLTMVLFLTSSGVQVLAQDMANETVAEAAQTEAAEDTAEGEEAEDPESTGETSETPETTPETTPTSIPSEDLEVTPTPAQTEDPEATLTPTPSEDSEATPIPTPSEESNVTPTPSEDPEPSPTPTAEAELTQDQLTFQIESTSTEAETGLVEIKVHYSLGKDAAQPVRTRIYMENQANMDFSQFERSRYTDNDGHSFKLSSNPDAKKYYIQYYVNPGEDFVQTFKMSVSGLEAGESADFTVRLETNSDPIPENWIVDSNVYNLTYTQPEGGESSSSIWDDLQAGKTVTLTASFGGARAAYTIHINQGTKHSYGRWGNGDGWSTFEYNVSIPELGIYGTAFCINPAAYGPAGTYQDCVIDSLNNDTIAKICYYARHIEDEDGFFKKKHPDFTQEDAFIIGHIAAGYINEGNSWDNHANNNAQKIALELISYCNENRDMSFSKTSLSVSEYYQEDGSWRQKSEEITFKADEAQSYTMHLGSDIKAHIDGAVQSGVVTIKGGTTFQLSAPLDTSAVGDTFTADELKVTSLRGGNSYIIRTGAFSTTNYKVQNLALILADATKESQLEKFTVNWNTGANISINKTGEKGNALSGAEFSIDYTSISGYSAENTTVATLTTDKNGKASLTKMLPPGSYTLRETKAPEGYVTAADISFTIDADGTITSDSCKLEDGVYVFSVVDEKNETSISGTKTWNVPEGFELPNSITVQLYQDGKEYGDPKEVKPDTEGNWTYNWDELPKYYTNNEGQRTTYNYTVAEVGIDGTTVAGNGNFTLTDGRGSFESTVEGTNIINKITGTTEVSGKKIWYDNENSDEIRPGSITVTLLCEDKNESGVKLETWDYKGPTTITTTAEENWSYSFENLPRYSNDGLIEYVYSVDESEIPDGYTSEIDGYDIINTHVASTSEQFSGTKELEGRKLLEDEFTFNLYEVINSEEVLLDTTTNDADGSFYFNSIRYSETGTHYYRITEEKGDLAGITYDETIYDICVEVSVGGENRDRYCTTKQITKAVDSDETTADDIVFHNQYQALGELVIDNIMKTLENSPLAAGQFTFELKDAQGNVLQTASNNADGSVAFDALKYTEKDIDKEYTYTVSEVNNNVTGVTYDNTVYTVNVKIQDSEPSDGTLQITQETWKDNTPVEVMTYTNTFKGSVKVNKTGQDGVVLPGAKFELYVQSESGEWVLYKADETTPAEYVTDENGMISVDGLAAGDYCFVETEAPLGYVISKEEDGSSKKYYFTIGIKDGDAGIVENAEVDQELNIENEVNPEDTTIEVTKLITYNDEEFDLIDETFYVALFDDEDLTNRVSDIKPIEFKNASASTVSFTDLKFGKTYYVAETDVDGNVIESGVFCEDGKFKVDFADGNYAEINEGDGTQTIIFENQIVTIPREYYKDGKLTITKKLIGANGSAKASSGVFYAGIFADKEHTQLSDLIEENIVKLDLNGNSSVSKTVKVALHPKETTTLYVTEVDENGKPVSDATDFKYVVTVEGSEATMDADKDKTEATVVITNRETETKKEVGGTAVKTGDDTMIAPFAVLLGISMAAVILLVLTQKRRRKS